MATPAELRRLTELGKQKKEKLEAEERVIADKKAQEAVREKALKEVVESQRIIDNVHSQLKWAADNGFPTARVYTIPSEDLQFKNNFQKKIPGKEQVVCVLNQQETNILNGKVIDYVLVGIAKRVFDHFKSEGFEVAIEEQKGPYDPEGPTCETYHIRVGW